MASLVAILGSIAAIVSAFYGFFKWITWKTQTTEQETNAEIDQQVQKEKTTFEETGRPQ